MLHPMTMRIQNCFASFLDTFVGICERNLLLKEFIYVHHFCFLSKSFTIFHYGVKFLIFVAMCWVDLRVHDWSLSALKIFQTRHSKRRDVNLPHLKQKLYRNCNLDCFRNYRILIYIWGDLLGVRNVSPSRWDDKAFENGLVITPRALGNRGDHYNGLWPGISTPEARSQVGKLRLGPAAAAVPGRGRLGARPRACRRPADSEWAPSRVGIGRPGASLHDDLELEHWRGWLWLPDMMRRYDNWLYYSNLNCVLPVGYSSAESNPIRTWSWFRMLT